MFIRGYIKGGTKEQNLIFSSSAEDIIPAYSYDNSANPNQREFVIPFTADTTKIITLESSANDVSGGIHGIHLSDTSDVLAPEVDSSFSMEFELSNSNNWQKAFSELPVVEVVEMNAGNTATTFMYSYFFEEIECIPETFYAVFTDSEGNVLLGDENNRIIYTANVAANNLPIGFDILKVDIQNIRKKLPDAKFTLRKLDEDAELHYPVPVSNGTFPGSTVEVSETDQENGKITFEGLQPGYYEVSETKAPYGYVLLDDAAIYVKVEKNGDVKLLKKQTQDDTVTWVEAEPNELVGKATLASSISPDGKAIAITVRNEPGAALPHTGGSGTGLIYFLGILLTCLAGVGLVMRKRIKIT
jgi:LPXTG-motif cell wall-anchored protein